MDSTCLSIHIYVQIYSNIYIYTSVATSIPISTPNPYLHLHLHHPSQQMSPDVPQTTPTPDPSPTARGTLPSSEPRAPFTKWRPRPGALGTHLWSKHQGQMGPAAGPPFAGRPFFNTSEGFCLPANITPGLPIPCHCDHRLELTQASTTLALPRGLMAKPAATVCAQSSGLPATAGREGTSTPGPLPASPAGTGGFPQLRPPAAPVSTP